MDEDILDDDFKRKSRTDLQYFFAEEFEKTLERNTRRRIKTKNDVYTTPFMHRLAIALRKRMVKKYPVLGGENE